MARVTTYTGDDGYTDLLGSRRVPKYHPRPEAYGTVDEATSALGLARALCDEPALRDDIISVQRTLYTAMAELATPPETYEKISWKVRAEDVGRLESLEAAYKQRVKVGKEFILPGKTAAGAALDLARSIVRRAERQVAKLYHDGEITNHELLRYLNRLSDLLFIVARYEESGRSDIASE